MKTLCTNILALAMIAIAPMLLSSTALGIGPSPGPGYVQVEMNGAGGDTSTMDEGCGPGFWHVQDIGGVKVCTPASSASTDRTYDPDSGRWVLP